MKFEIKKFTTRTASDADIAIMKEHFPWMEFDGDREVGGIVAWLLSIEDRLSELGENSE